MPIFIELNWLKREICFDFIVYSIYLCVMHTHSHICCELTYYVLGMFDSSFTLLLQPAWICSQTIHTSKHCIAFDSHRTSLHQMYKYFWPKKNKENSMKHFWNFHFSIRNALDKKFYKIIWSRFFCKLNQMTEREKSLWHTQNNTDTKLVLRVLRLQVYWNVCILSNGKRENKKKK